MICSSVLYSFQTHFFSTSLRTASGRVAITGFLSSERATGQVVPRRRRVGVSAALDMLASLGAVEDDPGAEIVAEVQEPMLRARGGEKRVAGTERHPRAAAGEYATPVGDD